MKKIKDLEELRSLYSDASGGAVTKVVDRITPLYQRWIEESRFMVLASVGEAGTDASPRGDTSPVVRVKDEHTLWLPDWRGNNRLDSLANIVSDGRVTLMFMVPGSTNVVRVNGHAWLTADGDCTATFERNEKVPRTVIVITVGEVYFQCAKALMRSQLWTAPHLVSELPTAGDFLREINETFDSKTYDQGYVNYSKDKLW